MSLPCPARYGDLVVISTWVEEVRSRVVAFGYEARMQETGQVLASGERSTFASITLDNRLRFLATGERC